MESLLSFVEDLTAIRAILGFILVFFLPGFAWTLSIIVLNLLLGMRINGTNALLTIIVMTVIPVGIYLFKRFRTANPRLRTENECTM